MRVLIYVAMFGLLAGCQPIVQRITGAQPNQQVTLDLNAAANATMRVQIVSRQAETVLSRIAVSNGVETWLSVDDISLSFQQGVLVASRGLGFDLMGANADATLQAMAGQGGPVYRRQMRYLTGDHQSTYLMAGCSMAFKGMDVVNGKHLERFEEKCQARRHVFTNVFWRNASGMIVQSRQWISPEVGYLKNSVGVNVPQF